jgi:DNA polymerase III delta subunit
MIYLFYGENMAKAREALHDFLDAFVKKNQHAMLFQMSAETWSGEQLDELIASPGLFGGANVVVLDSVFQNEEAGTFVLGKLVEMKDSPNTFVILEGKLTKTVSEKIKKKAEIAEEFSGTKAEKKAELSPFAIADALGRRSKKDAWVFLTKALAGGGVPEEIHSMLFWQVKSMILAASSKSAAEAGLNPFVFGKSLSFSKNFTEEELKKLSSRLVVIYHEARRGGDELPIALEKFVLSI